MHKGTVEVMALGDFSSSSTSVAGESVDALSVNALSLTALVGVFATSKVEVGGSTTVVKLGNLNTAGEVMGRVFFNFPNQSESAIVPFIGVGLGTTLGNAFGNAGIVGHAAVFELSGGFRVMTPEAAVR